MMSGREGKETISRLHQFRFDIIPLFDIYEKLLLPAN